MHMPGCDPEYYRFMSLSDCAPPVKLYIMLSFIVQEHYCRHLGACELTKLARPVSLYVRCLPTNWDTSVAS